MLIPKGFKHTKETKRKMSNAHKGKKFSKEHKRKISEALKNHIPWNKGIPHTEETKMKMRLNYADYQGKKHPQWGKTRSEETKRKLRQAHRGRKPSINTRLAASKKWLAEKTPQWKGGVAEYSNHALMKKARIEVLEKANGKCLGCDEKATEIHHIDASKDNHNLDNLVALCHTCHMNLHIEYTRRLL